MTNEMPKSTVVSSLEDVDYSDTLLVLFVLYDHPKDFPDKIVVRVWDAKRGATNIVWLADTLEQARAAMPPHFIRLPRSPTDDPVIIESYV